FEETFTTEWKGRHCYEIVHGKHSPYEECVHLKCLRTGRPATVEMEAGDRAVLYSATLIKDNNGHGRRVIHWIKDITSLKRLYEEREHLKEQFLHAQKLEAFGRFVGTIAHDFNNVLTGIMGHTELALMMAETDKLKKSIQTIQDAAERARDFIKQLMLFGRKSPPDKRLYDINRVIQEAYGLVTKLMGEDIEVRLHFIGSPVMVELDRAQFIQVILNLGANARDAMPDGGEFRLALEEEDGYIKVIVEDTGTGIPEEIQERIFEPFFTTKPEGSGTGLGLSVVKSVVEEHGGFIKLQSNPGKGTRFEIYLPISGARGQADDGEGKDKEGDAPPGGTERILLVDDDVLVLDSLRQVLESLGYTVTVATSGEAALEKIRQDPEGYDLIISDIVMPGMKGGELYEQVKGLAPHVAFVLMTGYGEHTLSGLQRYGVDDVLKKPLSLKEVSYRIRDVLDRKKLKSPKRE
ncbi:MAG: response regulator, partial [Nitrospirae bacterium]